MCGIAGILGPGAETRRVHAMTEALAHRGPDGEGVWTAPGICLGHRRLSIIDLSDDGSEPMVSADGRYVLTFNGEIYNYVELRRELDAYPYRSRTDTEVILAAYDAWGEACLERFVGMFAFALWDVERGRLFCARDRLGIKPFHYTLHGGDLLFASEIKALLAAGVRSRPDTDTWATYLTHGVYDHGASTFFRDVWSLRGGHALTVDADHEVTEWAWWDLGERTREDVETSDREAETRLRELFEDSVRLRLRSDVPLGVNLSGGLDSASLVVTVDAVASAAGSTAVDGSLQTFTAAWDDPAYDEVDFADRVPRALPWSRHIQRLRPDDVWRLAVDATWHQEAPFGGIGTLGYHHLHARAAHEGITVLLEGQGVDEMLAGYRYFLPPHHLDLLEAGECWSARQAFRDEARVHGGRPRDALGRVRDLLGGDQGPVYQDGSSFLARDALAPAVRAEAGPYPLFDRPYTDRLRNALYRDLRHTKLPRVLRMNDRLSMAFGRELREPFLDHRIVEFLFRLPAEQRVRAGRSKELLRRAMGPRLPASVRNAPKRPVVTPQREWLRGPLADGIERLLASDRFRGRGLFDANQCLARFRSFRAGHGTNAFFVWQWVGTELWFRRWVEGDAEIPEELRGPL